MVATIKEKKRWIKQIYSDSQETGIRNISWSDSDTEEPPFKKQPISDSESPKKTNWIKQNVTPTKDKLSKTSSGLQEFLSGRDSPTNSPIISRFKLEQSPVLPIHNIVPKKKSPIISRSKVIQKLKWRREQNKYRIEEEKSPTKTELNISPPHSPEKFIDSSRTQSDSSELYYIDTSSTQNSLDIVSDHSSSSNGIRDQKKFPKSGTLANQLLKAINLKNTSAAIWQHEKFLQKSKSSLIASSPEFEFYVLEEWIEFGCNIFKCESNKDTKLIPLTKDKSIFLLISSNTCIQNNHYYQIAPPYSSKMIIYGLESFLCIFNVSKIREL